MAVSEWGGEDFDGGLVALLSFRETAGSSFNRNHEESEKSESKHHKRREGASEREQQETTKPIALCSLLNTVKNVGRACVVCIHTRPAQKENEKLLNESATG